MKKLFSLAMVFEDDRCFESAAGWALAASKEEAIEHGIRMARERHPGRSKYQCVACEVPSETDLSARLEKLPEQLQERVVKWLERLANQAWNVRESDALHRAADDARLNWPEIVKP